MNKPQKYAISHLIDSGAIGVLNHDENAQDPLVAINKNEIPMTDRY